MPPLAGRAPRGPSSRGAGARWGACACLVGFVALVSCRADSVTASTDCTVTTTAVTLTVTRGTSPTISWTPACPVWLFLIENKESGHDDWFVVDTSTDTTTAANTILPPLSYGVQPAGTNQNPAGPQPLFLDSNYTVAVWRVMSNTQAANACQGQLGKLCLMGVKFITP